MGILSEVKAAYVKVVEAVGGKESAKITNEAFSELKQGNIGNFIEKNVESNWETAKNLASGAANWIVDHPGGIMGDHVSQTLFGAPLKDVNKNTHGK